MAMIKKGNPGKRLEALKTRQKRKGVSAGAKPTQSTISPAFFLSASLSIEDLETDNFFHFKAFRTSAH